MKWRVQEEVFLLQNFYSLPIKQLSKVLRKDRRSVYAKAGRLGLSRKHKVTMRVLIEVQMMIETLKVLELCAKCQSLQTCILYSSAVDLDLTKQLVKKLPKKEKQEDVVACAQIMQG